MARKVQDPEVVVRVTYVTDPENAKAAQDILEDGLKRALIRALVDRRAKMYPGS